MIAGVQIENLTPGAICKSEVLRYAQVGDCKDERLSELLEDCIIQAQNAITYKLCYKQLPLEISGDVCNLGEFSVKSQKLAKHLCGCKSVIVFAATLGTPLDRLIAKNSRLSPARALMLSCIGNERVEALCDCFCEKLCKTQSIRPRFSAGYGDIALDVQKDIFKALDCTKNAGIFLSDSLLMTPSKSVTAFIGVL